MFIKNKINLSNAIKLNNLYEKKSFSFDALENVLNTTWVSMLLDHLFYNNALIKNDSATYRMEVKPGSNKITNKIFLLNVEIQNIELVSNANTALTEILTEFNKFYISLEKKNNVELSSDNILEMYDSFKSSEEQKILTESIEIAEKNKNKPRI